VSTASTLAAIGLDKVPFVAERIAEYGDDAVMLFSRLFEERDAGLAVATVVAPEVVGLQKQEYASACLVADRLRWATVAARASRSPVSRLPGGATTTQRLSPVSGVSSTGRNPSAPT